MSTKRTLPALICERSSASDWYGARVVVAYGGHRQAQEVLAQAGFLSVNDKRLQFGLGKVGTVDVEVRWPSGVRQQFAGVAANQFVTIDELRGITEQHKLRS
jgi:hypothetical protein